MSTDFVNKGNNRNVYENWHLNQKWLGINT
jgi:hypothetical protein